MSTATTSGSATRHGPLWSARARDWAENEEQQVPTYEEALRRVEVAGGDAVLDVGCGSGVFLRLAADRGARVAGIDASDALVELARERVPEADVRVAEMESLPFDDCSFDLVAGGKVGRLSNRCRDTRGLHARSHARDRARERR